jgi:multidrug transporter EmrE-like cation transporter
MGHVVFGEPLPKKRLMAISLIVAGVALVGWGGI